MQNFKSLSIVMPFVIIHSRKQEAHASRPCVSSTALVRRFASDRQVFCRQWQKTHFAPRAHRTAVMRIMRRSTLRPRPTFAHNVPELWQKASLRYAFCAPICRSRGFCGRVSRRVLYCCETAAARETERRANGERWVSLPLTTFSFISLKEKV